MKEIQLTRGYVALVDDEDYELVSQYNWSVSIKNHTCYARSRLGKADNPDTLLHRFLLNAPAGVEVDHKDGNGLNCQRSNIRLATSKQNNCNKWVQGEGYRGVTLRPNGRYQARIRDDERRIVIGTFDTDLEAARAYDEAARKYHGEFAMLNFN